MMVSAGPAGFTLEIADMTRYLMKILIALTSTLFVAQSFAKDTPAPQLQTETHRYVIERTFPPDALKGLDANTKKKVNANNASVGVRWVESYANAAKTKTFCVYEGPNEAAIRKAAELNKLPVDSITEVPVTLLPQ
jgi:Protein of unknown function (DUF4242)